jgi:hypothetical protein
MNKNLLIGVAVALCLTSVIILSTQNQETDAFSQWKAKFSPKWSQ